MDNKKTGELIFKLRSEKGLTQKQLADMLNVSDKAVSKWERGQGLPDVSLLPELGAIFGVNIEGLLGGGLNVNSFATGNMKKVKFYVCPICGNITICTGSAEITCCSRKIGEVIPRKTDFFIKIFKLAKPYKQRLITKNTIEIQPQAVQMSMVFSLYYLVIMSTGTLKILATFRMVSICLPTAAAI